MMHGKTLWIALGAIVLLHLVTRRKKTGTASLGDVTLPDVPENAAIRKNLAPSWLPAVTAGIGALEF